MIRNTQKKAKDQPIIDEVKVREFCFDCELNELANSTLEMGRLFQMIIEDTGRPQKTEGPLLFLNSEL